MRITSLVPAVSLILSLNPHTPAVAASFSASHESGTLNEWHSSSVSDSRCSIRAVRARDEGIPRGSGEYVVKATLAGGGSDYARVHFQHDNAGTARWREGSNIRYAASFYLPRGFYAAKNSSSDIMRWDAYVNGERDMQGGLGMRRDDTLRIMSNYPYTEPLRTRYKIPEGRWTRIEVRQRLSQTNGKALNAIYANGALVGSSTAANYKGSKYPPGQRSINRLRVGLVSEGNTRQRITLYFDRFSVSY